MRVIFIERSNSAISKKIYIIYYLTSHKKEARIEYDEIQTKAYNRASIFSIIFKFYLVHMYLVSCTYYNQFFGFLKE